ncbi:MAG: hypothetical protein KL787_07865 [Taibaiella sp.]|nr:hypothetical protein [Taibaiella sp.]MBX9449616.1 hypothetical protein [Taibaiella sp.]
MHAYENLSLTDMPGEQWKPIDGFEDLYEVSSMGRVKSLRREVSSKSRNMRMQAEQILRQRVVKVKNKRVGDFLYTMIVSLSQDGKRYYFSVGRLVYHAFIAPIDLGSRSMLISYRDGDGRNLSSVNLYASNLSELKLRSFRSGRALSHLNVLSKPVSQFLPDGRLIAQYPSYYAAAKATGFQASSIASVASGGDYLYKGFCWQQGKRKSLRASSLPAKKPEAGINYKLLEKTGDEESPENLFRTVRPFPEKKAWRIMEGYSRI